MLVILVYALAFAAAGALVGLIPFFLCRSQGKPNIALLALLLCTVGGTVFVVLGVILAIAFSIAAFTATRDCRPIFKRQSQYQAPGSVTYEHNHRNSGTRLALSCISGPMCGQTYRLGTDGIMIGRDADCGIRYASSTPGISRHHCSVRWYNGGPALVDLGSSYGSYLIDGRKLIPNSPIPIQPGNRFYLGSPQYLFELVAL